MDLVPLLILVTVAYFLGIIVGASKSVHHYLLGFRHGAIGEAKIIKDIDKKLLKEYNIELKEE